MMSIDTTPFFFFPPSLFMWRSFNVLCLVFQSSFISLISLHLLSHPQCFLPHLLFFLSACLSPASVFPVSSVFCISIYCSAIAYVRDPVLQLLSVQSSGGISASSLAPSVSCLSPLCHQGRGSVDSPVVCRDCA